MSTDKKSEEKIESEESHSIKSVASHKRIQTAEGWKRKQGRISKPSKTVSKS